MANNAYSIAGNTVIDDTPTLWGNIIQAANLVYSFAFQGTNYGYASGGDNNPTVYNIIERYPFAASTTNTTDVGDLLGNRTNAAGASSKEYGYVAGGWVPPYSNVIQRWPFSAGTTNAADVGDIYLAARSEIGDNSTSLDGYGYTTGGWRASPTAVLGTLDRWPFASGTENAALVGALSVSRAGTCGQCAVENYGYGYCSGGSAPPSTTSNVTDRYPYAASSTNAVDVGNLSVARYNSAAASSVDYGYTSGGYVYTPGARLNTIDRFPFAVALVNSTDVGDLLAVTNYPGGTSSREYAYAQGGGNSVNPGYNTIQRWPFAATTTNTADVGDLVTARWEPSGQQY